LEIAKVLDDFKHGRQPEDTDAKWHKLKRHMKHNRHSRHSSRVASSVASSIHSSVSKRKSPAPNDRSPHAIQSGGVSAHTEEKEIKTMEA